MSEVLDHFILREVNGRILILPSPPILKENTTLTRVFLSDGSFMILSPEAWISNINKRVSELEVGDEIPFLKFKRKKKQSILAEDLIEISPVPLEAKNFKLTHKKRTEEILPDRIKLSPEFGEFCGLLCFGGFQWRLKPIKDYIRTLPLLNQPRIRIPPRFRKRLDELAQITLGTNLERLQNNQLFLILLHWLGFEKKNSIIPPNFIQFNNQFLYSLIKTIIENHYLLDYRLAVNLYFILSAVGLKSTMVKETSDLFGDYLLVRFDNPQERSVMFIDNIKGDFLLYESNNCILNIGVKINDQ